VRNQIVPFFGGMPIEQVTPQAIEVWRAQLNGGARTKNKILTMSTASSAVPGVSTACRPIRSAASSGCARSSASTWRYSVTETQARRDWSYPVAPGTPTVCHERPAPGRGRAPGISRRKNPVVIRWWPAYALKRPAPVAVGRRWEMAFVLLALYEDPVDAYRTPPVRASRALAGSRAPPTGPAARKATGP
jgi:hypothetical protein